MLNQDVLAFIAVVKLGSFTQAADSMGTSKARISQQVSRLEKQLGTTLLHRSTRKLRLTDLGESYYTECLRALSILELAGRQIAEDQEAISGVIRLNSVGGLFAEQMLMPAVLAFMRDHPHVDVQLDFSSTRVDVMAEHYDLVVRMGQLKDSSQVARTLLQLGSNAVASPEYINTYGRPAEPGDLQRHECLCGSIKKWRFENTVTGDSQEVGVSGRFTVPNGYALCQAAIQGLGIVRLHDLYLKPHIDAGRLLPVFSDWTIASQPVSLIYPKVRYKTRRIQAFVEHLVSWFEQNHTY